MSEAKLGPTLATMPITLQYKENDSEVIRLYTVSESLYRAAQSKQAQDRCSPIELKEWLETNGAENHDLWAVVRQLPAITPPEG